MIATDNQPLSLTEREGFKQFIKTVQPLYTPPCESTITSMMDRKYKSLQIKMKTILRAQKNLTLTTDIWTETMTTKSYIGLTCHYLDGRFILFTRSITVINNKMFNN